MSGAPETSWVVTQSIEGWPSKDYRFADKSQALMFLRMCQRDGDVVRMRATAA